MAQAQAQLAVLDQDCLLTASLILGLNRSLQMRVRIDTLRVF
jgi:hypothetical protein